ncbi:hypothetical protein BABINDRAFT_7708 [Babjeviella inositovora NRRL Y-12698]|uniref:HTH APSES-type domain-containing protein n=1 Tax=Babjeviella inositovora NRRL Y-12698 TaxID=984486 RepID=A0A1E3QRC9_9ASCO|nr:uncharacterized protein BABINDRAFT_7708 [Babjeviella inositovora NRRL Y-12698]ODQ80249.1 hypothetical protein BABINDRAFT_7708 [Babjeviella inositovora NRRL Y-12698]
MSSMALPSKPKKPEENILNDVNIQKFLIDLRPPQFDVSPVYTATYTGIAVIEMTVNGVSVMRRRNDLHFNATQILKIANVDKPLRTKILETRIHTGVHEKIQGGYGKYQGTWIPYERAVALAQQLGVYDAIKPLLMYNVASSEARLTMTKEQANVDMKASMRSVTNSSAGLNSFTIHRDAPEPATRNFSSITDDDEAPSPTKKPKHASGSFRKSFAASPQYDAAFVAHTHDTALPNPNSPFTLEPVSALLPEFEASREYITAIFLSDQPGQLDGNVNWDVPIDDLGHTALHWAATLARLELVKELVERGANRLRGNADGESALVRAVLVTNNSDQSSFPELLDWLYPCITLLDHHGRTILHHIALTAGIKGRSSALRHYLECLLEWVVRRGLYLKEGQLSLGRFMNEVVNVQDKNGDTCLNIAARIGNKAIVQQLLDVGADPSVANKAGLKPADFGISIKHSEDSGAATAVAAIGVAALYSTSQSSSKLFELMQAMLGRLHEDFQAEVGEKQAKLQDLHAQLRERTQQLSHHRTMFEELSSSERELMELRQKIGNLDLAIEKEDARFKEQTGDQYDQFQSFEGDFDADEPFRIDGVYQQVEEALREDADVEDVTVDVTGIELPDLELLHARIRAYKKNEALLEGLALELTSKSADLELKFRHVVSLCTGVEEERVDALLEGLVAAVESDPDDVDLGRVKGFLKKVET